MQARVTVKLKKPVLDPQGLAISRSLSAMGYAEVASVRQGKTFDIELKTDNPAEAEKRLAEMAGKLLANTVIEDYEVEIIQS
jgi:phosphoribosylformylglycinamidine synthase